MKHRILGRTNLAVAPLALGTVELGMDYGIQTPDAYGKPDEADAIRLVHAALDAGINLIDTARAYGTSESVLGKALRHRRDRVVLATKAVTRLPDGTMPQGAALAKLLLEQIDQSLQALQTEAIDIWQLHNVTHAEMAQWETIDAVFTDVKRSGKVQWVGGSFYGPDICAEVLQNDWLDTVQVTYSVFDQRLEDQVFALAEANNVGVIVRSVLLKGALTARADYLPNQLEPLRTHSRSYRQLVSELDLPLTAAQTAVAFALHHPQIHAALMGVRTIGELHENLQATQTQLSESDLQQLRQLRIDDEQLLNPGTWGF
ncbi:MAG: aldo/keto reductase [Chloroflexota bacterium]